MLIHCVKAYNEVIAIFKEMQPKQTWIIHGFSGSQQLMEQLLDLGFYLSFGKAITNVKSKAYEVFKDVITSYSIHYTKLYDSSPNESSPKNH